MINIERQRLLALLNARPTQHIKVKRNWRDQVCIETYRRTLIAVVNSCMKSIAEHEGGQAADDAFEGFLDVVTMIQFTCPIHPDAPNSAIDFEAVHDNDIATCLICNPRKRGGTSIARAARLR